MIRSDYVTAINIYVKRRDELRIESHRKKLQQKIDGWRKQIKRMDERMSKITALGNNVAYFTGINVKNIRNMGGRYVEREYAATALFSKWGLENRIEGTFLSEYMGKPKEAASRTRLAFTRSFTKHPERRDLYYRFKEYMENILEDIKNGENSNEKF